MRIVHATRHVAPLGGAETYLRALAELQVARGDEVTIAHADEAMPPTGVASARLREARSIDADIVHIHGDALGADDATGLASVRSLHDLTFACSTGEYWYRNGAVCSRAHGPGCIVALGIHGCGHRPDPRPALRGYRRVSRLLEQLRETRATVVYSDFVRDLALRNGLDAERVHTIPYFTRAPAEAPAPAVGRSVAFVGRIVRNKGLDVLLEALASIPASWDELLVAGDGWDAPYARTRADELGLAARVRFLGWASTETVSDVLAEAAVLALPSRWPEPFGIVGIEAMAAARPVVASGIGGIPEWLEAGETGRIVAPGDPAALASALAALLGDELERARIGHNAWSRAARFSPERHLALLDDVYAGAA